VSVLETLQVDSVLSYVLALVLPALDAIIPAVPSETAIITLGVTTAGSTDPRIALLVACAAIGAFVGDNICYLLGRRFGPAVERRFFAGEKGTRLRAWAERSLDRYGPQLIVVCRFIPGGRTAVTLTCGLVEYSRRRFVAATAVAAVIWALYAFLIGRLGGKAFEHNIWAGLAVAFGVSIAVSGLIELIRRLRGRSGRRGDGGSRGDAGQVQPDDPGQDQPDRDELGGRDGVAEEDHADRGRAGRADPGPDRVGGPDRELPQRDREQGEGSQRAQREPGHRPRDAQAVAQLEAHGEAGLEQARRNKRHPRHQITPRPDLGLPHLSRQIAQTRCAAVGDAVETAPRPSPQRLHAPSTAPAQRSPRLVDANPSRKAGTAMLGTGAPVFNPVSAAWNTVARFDDYESAQRAVDRLSDDGFPVENLDLVGSGLRLVERVTGRLTTARATGAGAMSGLWAGLLIGILLGLFTAGHSVIAVIVTAAAVGAAGGAAFGYLAHARTRGQRDFSSVRALTATHYDLIAREGTVDRARRMLGDAGLLPDRTAEW
jgi:membrane-associated protein